MQGAGFCVTAFAQFVSVDREVYFDVCVCLGKFYDITNDDFVFWICSAGIFNADDDVCPLRHAASVICANC